MHRLIPALVLLVATPAFADIGFTAPEGWKAEEVTNKLRKHQLHVPRVEGDARDAKVLVYYFGANGGGTLAENKKRWEDQIARGEGDPEVKVSTRTCNGAKVVIHDQTGSYTAPAFRPDAPKAKPAPDTRLINVFVATSEGNYFIRIVGPKKTVAANYEAFLAFLDSMTLSEGVTPREPPSLDEQPTSQPADD